MLDSEVTLKSCINVWAQENGLALRSDGELGGDEFYFLNDRELVMFKGSPRVYVWDQTELTWVSLHATDPSFFEKLYACVSS